jgi:hypothetical protein
VIPRVLPKTSKSMPPGPPLASPAQPPLCRSSRPPRKCSERRPTGQYELLPTVVFVSARGSRTPYALHSAQETCSISGSGTPSGTRGA